MEDNEESPNVASKIFMDNKAKLPNDVIALEDSTIRYEHQLQVPPFQPP